MIHLFYNTFYLENFEDITGCIEISAFSKLSIYF